MSGANRHSGPISVVDPSARGRARARETRRTDEDVYGEYDEVAATEEGAAISGQAGPRLCKERRQNTLSSDAVSRARSRLQCSLSRVPVGFGRVRIAEIKACRRLRSSESIA